MMRTVLDATTLQFVAALARASASGIPATRAHHHVAVETLRVFADEIEAVAKGDQPAGQAE